MAGTVLASTIKHDVSGVATVFKDGAGTEIGRLLRCYLNYNATTTTVNGSYNVSSVTRSSAGVFVNNFTTSMVDANYGGAMSSGDTATYSDCATFWGNSTSPINLTASSHKFCTSNYANVFNDKTLNTVTIFR